LSGRLVVIAPARARRPGAARGTLEPATAEELETCPFCQGREGRTPPETLALGRDHGESDSPGWLVRVVPNLYPAFERQEVVVHSPEHVRSLAELDDAQLALVADAWQARAAANRDVGYLHALVNEGRGAGASLAHSHSQLVWLRETPPAVIDEQAAAVPELLARDELRVAERNGVVAVAHPAGRGPYELLIAPGEPPGDPFAGDALAAALRLLADAVRRLRAVEGAVPWNAWLHAGDWWHLELLPRLSVLAGIELGAGVYVNALPPEQAAATLRGALPG
jgi:UDPglucose--hexose-1-phosphate uridylyltransferase